MTYKIRTRRHKTYSSAPKIKASLYRHSIRNNQLTDRGKNNNFQDKKPINFNLQNLPISHNIQRQNILSTELNNTLVQLKQKERQKPNVDRLETLYYQYRNGKRYQSLASVRMSLVEQAIKYYEIDTNNAELKYINNAQMDRNVVANYTLKDDNTIEKTFIKFYPQLFQLPFNSFINAIRREAKNIVLYNQAIYDVDWERRCHKHINDFLAEAKEILDKNQENPQQFYQDANRALRHWISIYKNEPLPDLRDAEENQLMESIEKQFDRVQRQVTKRYADFVDEYGKDNQLAKKLRDLVKGYEQNRP